MPDATPIIVALIACLSSVVGSAIASSWRIKSLEARVDKHNGYAEKFAQCTQDIALIRNDINTLRDSMERLQRFCEETFKASLAHNG